MISETYIALATCARRRIEQEWSCTAAERAVLQRMSDRFPEGVNVLVCPPAVLQPEFIRLPKAGELCPVTGLPRTTLIELLQEAGPKKIPVRHLRKPGATTGIALIPRQALVDYINQQPAPEWMEAEKI